MKMVLLYEKVAENFGMGRIATSFIPPKRTGPAHRRLGSQHQADPGRADRDRRLSARIVVGLSGNLRLAAAAIQQTLDEMILKTTQVAHGSRPVPCRGVPSQPTGVLRHRTRLGQTLKHPQLPGEPLHLMILGDVVIRIPPPIWRIQAAADGVIPLLRAVGGAILLLQAVDGAILLLQAMDGAILLLQTVGGGTLLLRAVNGATRLPRSLQA